jgi:glycosyltransferase involved in cell wall biosynthesis
VLFWGPFFVALGYDLLVTRLAALRDRIGPLHIEPAFSVIVPCLAADRALEDCLDSVRQQTRQPAEVLLASADADPLHITEERYPFPLEQLVAPVGRGNQIHAAIERAKAPWIVVLHADSTLPAHALAQLATALRAAPDTMGGAFGQRFKPESIRTLPIELLNDARSLLAQMPFGDQVQFFRRDLAIRFDLVPAQPLMEDVELSLRLRRLGPTLHLGTNAVSRASRWNHAPWLQRFWLIVRLFSRYRLARLRSYPRAAALADELYGRYYGSGTRLREAARSSAEQSRETGGIKNAP